MKYHKKFHEIAWEFAEKWTEQEGLELANVDYVNPATGKDTLNFVNKFEYIGKIKEGNLCPEIVANESFSNSKCDTLKNNLHKKLFLKQYYLWDIDYQFIIPPSIYTNPILPPCLSKKINPAIQVDLFKRAYHFESQLNNSEIIEAGIYIEPNQTINAKVIAEYKNVKQKYYIHLEISGSIVIEVKKHRNSCKDSKTFYTIPIVDLYKSELAHNHFFHLDGETVIFTEKGMFKGLICSNVFIEGERFNLKTGECLGEYIIPLGMGEEKVLEKSKPIFFNSEKGGI
ncbi:hypothetical protein P4G96_04135 [Bacillus cereus]|nr:hypothetical protein [Bacillus cereus]MEB8666850.1 hypothetical protein [Bacillus cereus]